MNDLALRNRQRRKAVNLPMLRRLTRALLEQMLKVGRYELCVHLVDAREMTEVNEHYLAHPGSTDVITFNHLETEQADRIYGEIYISIDDAIRQAREFKTTWQSELARYVVHGLLHLIGHDDLSPGPRKAMKSEENRLMKQLEADFALSKLAGKTKVSL